ARCADPRSRFQLLPDRSRPVTAVVTRAKHAAALTPTPRTSRKRRRRVSPLNALRLLVLFGFAVFCIVPLIWLLLAPTKNDNQLLDQNPLSFGSIHRAVLAWRHLA